MSYFSNEEISFSEVFSLYENIKMTSDSLELVGIAKQIDVFYQQSHKDFENVKENELAIIESVSKFLRSDEINPIAVLNYYILKIETLPIMQTEKEYCITTMMLYKNCLIYATYGMEYSSNNSPAKAPCNDCDKRKWDCTTRDCFDCCMYRKLQAKEASMTTLEYIAWFVSQSYLWDTAVFLADCSWDCYVNGNRADAISDNNPIYIYYLDNVVKKPKKIIN